MKIQENPEKIKEKYTRKNPLRGVPMYHVRTTLPKAL
jgi:hypothetical protein